MTRSLRAALIAVASLGVAVLSADAQVLPSEPIALAGGRVTFSGDASASIAPADTGFFNYTDYDHSALRVLTVDLTTSITPNPHLSMLGEIRDEVGLLGQPSDDSRNTLRVYALYVRIRPWVDRGVDIQAGRVPPTFGAFARRVYANDNPLIGYPLAYQYLTSLRPDAVPLNADDLLKMRGRGWLSSFSIGNQTPESGVALVTAFRWDTGVQLHVGSDTLDGTVAVTSGTLSDPRTFDDNSAPQVVGRVSARPIPGLVLGVSASSGPFVSSTATRAAVGGGHDNSFTQTAFGGDIEYSRDYYLIRAETVWSAWKLPVLGAPVIDSPLTAQGTYVEGRYKLQPGLYVAGRVDHLGFSEVVGSAGPQTWDAPVTRVEVGAGYSIQRNVLLKVSCQHNARDGGRVSNATYVAAQLVYWF